MSNPMKICAIASAAAMLGFLTAGNVQAATAKPGLIQLDTTVIVSPAQDAAFSAGVKNLNQCLQQHADKHATYVYASFTGRRGVYDFVTAPMSWAELDAMHGDQNCTSVFMSDVLPHIAHATTTLLKLEPGFSHNPNGTQYDHLVTVVAFTLKGGGAANQAFRNAAKEIYAASEKTKAPRPSSMYSVISSGADAADYVLVEPRKDWVEFGTPGNSLEKLLTDSYGKTKADAIIKSLGGSLKSVSARVVRYDSQLSYTPSSH